MTTHERLYVFAGGGSGGHLYPGLAVAEALCGMGSGNRVLFLATGRAIDGDILCNHSYEYLAQPIEPLPNRVSKVVSFFLGWRGTLRMCRDLFSRRSPDLVLGLGGYAAGAAMKVGFEKKIPVAMLNPDALPGKANVYGAKFCERIFLQWEETANCFKEPGKCLALGCPIRGDLLEVSREDAAAEFGLRSDLKTLVIMGGSLGGHNVNVAVMACLRELRKVNATDGWQFLHLTGKEDHGEIEAGYRKLGLAAAVLAFTEKMSAVLACGDLVIARAGASTLAELTAKGLASILLPYPYHKDQHQNHNARNLEVAGSARVVADLCDGEKTAQELSPVVLECMGNLDRRNRMATAARQLGRADAAKEIACELEKLATNCYNTTR